MIESGGLGCTGYLFGVEIESAADHVVPFITTVSGSYQVAVFLLSPGGGSITYSNSSSQLSPPTVLIGQNGSNISLFTQPSFPYRRCSKIMFSFPSLIDLIIRLRWDGVFVNFPNFFLGSSAGLARGIVEVDILFPGSGCTEGGILKERHD